MIPFSRPTISKEEVEAVSKVLRSGWLAAGPQTTLFEKEFCEYIDAKYCIFTNCGTSALKMAYKYFLEKGVKRFVGPRNTYSATYVSCFEMGGKYVFEDSKEYFDIYDCVPTTVSVSYAGVKDEIPCLIEDSAHRIEPNDPLIGKIRCYSFHATKNMTTGQGGMFVTNDKEIYKKARLWWNDGRVYDHDRRGVYKIMAMAGGYDGGDVQAAIGRVQLKKLPMFNRRRGDIVKRYNDSFGQAWDGNHLYPFFTKSVGEVKKMIKFMRANDVECSWHYPNTGWTGVSLPLYPLLKDSDVEYIIEKVKEWRRNNAISSTTDIKCN